MNYREQKLASQPLQDAGDPNSSEQKRTLVWRTPSPPMCCARSTFAQRVVIRAHYAVGSSGFGPLTLNLRKEQRKLASAATSLFAALLLAPCCGFDIT